MENVVVYLYDINNMKICDFRSVKGEAVSVIFCTDMIIFCV